MSKVVKIICILGLLILLFCNIMSFLRIVKLNNEVCHFSDLIFAQQSQLDKYNNYILENIKLREININKLSENIKRVGIPDSDEEYYVLLFPKSGCGSCVTTLSIILTEMSVNPGRVHIVSEVDNLHLKNNLYGGYDNYYVDNNVFKLFPGISNLIFLKIQGKEYKLMTFDVELKQYMPVFLQGVEK